MGSRNGGGSGGICAAAESVKGSGKMKTKKQVSMISMKKRAIAFLMAFAMVMSLLPGTAVWGGEVEGVNGDTPSTGDNQENTDITSLGINGLEEGKTYCVGVTFSVAENVKVTIGDEEMSPGEDGKYTINVTGDYAIKRSDGKNKEITINVTVAEDEWDMEGAAYDWAEDGSRAKLIIPCKHDSTHTETYDMEIKSEVKVPATCTEKGTTTYTATAEVRGKKYEASKDVVDILELDHEWDMENVVYKWAEDGSKAEVIFPCKHDSTHTESHNLVITETVKEPATCIKKGITTYTGTATINDVVYTDSKDIENIEIDLLNHEGETTIKNKKKETCVEKGYTGDVFCKACDAKISEGKEIKAIGHAMSNGVVTKEPTKTSEGILTYTCKNGCGHTSKSLFSKKAVTVELGGAVTLFSDTSACKIKNFNASKYKKYFEIDKKTGKIKTKKYYKVKIKKEIPVKVVVNGKPYTVKIRIKIPAPEVKITRKKDILNGEAAYRYTFTYKEKKAKKIQVRIKNLKEANSVLDQYVSKNKSNKDSYIKIKQKRVKKLGKKITFEIIASYGKNKSEKLIIRK